MQDKLRQIEAELNDGYFEREEVVRGILIGLLAREHVLLLGPPGTAKSELTEDVCSRINGQYFRWLLSRTSSPDELLGPVSLAALENDSYRRIAKGKLPEANVAFLDEIFKCNSAVLNNLLSILNERMFFNDGEPTNVPVESVIGASNEIPEEKDELGAIWDRFLMRFNVGYIGDNDNFHNLLLRNGTKGTVTEITLEELHQAQEEAMAVKVEPAIETLMNVREGLGKEGMKASDRRYVKCLKMLRANAYLEGRDEANEEDVHVLFSALWDDPSDERKVRQVILKSINPALQEVNDLLGEAEEIFNGVQATLSQADGGASLISGGRDASVNLKSILRRIEGIANQEKAAGRKADKAFAARDQVKGYLSDVINTCLKELG